jgi:hypothetical protein
VCLRNFMVLSVAEGEVPTETVQSVSWGAGSLARLRAARQRSVNY